ncbi:hypothetical protein JIG36_45940 [Actinoplanes sp. LDG1-06]|uniref:Serine/threonine protein kinase n=1 Tax=Paractinoplanes ovalisporus TaxID=2810368 RepID=A0ABS2AU07_9ACTN|nr:hypothetical protein [Actinoplanes ovalisporus]MBM2622868.1 hypothetical protein [Actinoplanes ovalisporus]
MPGTGAPAEPQREGTARRPALPAVLEKIETVPRWALFGGLAVLLIACLGTAALQVTGGGSESPLGAFATVTPSAPARPQKPKASPVPVRASDDLGRVCEGWYYPDSPRYDGRGPHRIAIGVAGTDRLYRVKAALDVPHTLKRSVREAWMPSDPAQSELVACVTLARTGSRLTTCEKVALKRGVHVLALYEVATGRKLLQREVNGDVTRCPNVIPLGTGDTIATTVSDGYLYSVLDRYVTGRR